MDTALRNRAIVLLLVGALCTLVGCDDNDTLSSPAFDPSGEWTVTKTTESNSCDQGIARPGSPVSTTTVTTETFVATVRTGPGGVIDVIRTTTGVIGDDVDLEPFERCGTILFGILEGDRVEFDYSERNVFEGAIDPFGGSTTCDVSFDMSMELVFTASSFAGTEQVTIASCGDSCSTMTTYEAVRCETCAPVEGCEAIGSDTTPIGGGRDTY